MRIKLLGLVCLLMAQAFSLAHAQPAFSQQFQLDTIGPGSYSELIFTIDNAGGSTVTDLDFSNNLPAAVSVGSLMNNTCQGTALAVSGGSTITLTDGILGANQNCTVHVSVTSSTPGVHTNTSGDLTSSAGNSGTSTDDLEVVTDRPGISMSFAPSQINLGEPSTLTYTIDNSTNASAIYSIQLSQQLPQGLVFDQPDINTSTCPSSLVVDHQSQSFSIPFDPNFQNTLAAGATCTLTVNVIGTANQNITLQSGALTSSVFQGQPPNSGFAEASIEVQGQELQLVKSFIDDPTAPGSTAQLHYKLTLLNRTFGATAVTFSDDIAAVVPGTSINSILSNNCNANITGINSGLLNFASGSLAAEQSCEFILELQSSAATTAGVYTSSTSDLNYVLDGQNKTASSATANWVIEPSPILSMAFLTDPVLAGNSTDIEYTITNTSSTSAATDVTFTHQIVPFLPFPASVTLPANDFCGAGSTATLAFLDTEQQGILVTGGQLNPAGMAGDSCTFVVTVDIPLSMPTNTYNSQTESISATVDGATRIGMAASDQLQILNAPAFRHEFTDDPALPGNTVNLMYEIILPAESPSAASAIGFTHDLNAVLAGLSALGLPQNNCGGTLSGTTTLTFSGGNLSAGDTCLINIAVQVPAGAALGTYASITSGLSASIAGFSTSGQPSSDDLHISAIDFSMNIMPGQIVAAEQNVSIEFTIENLDPVNDATGIFFTDNLSNELSGWQSIDGTVNDICGTGSQQSGTTFLIVTGGNLPPGGSCSFTVNTTIPVSTTTGLYNNITSNLTATVSGNTITIDPSSDTLEVIEGLSFSQQFTDDPVAPGGVVNLEFTIENNATSTVNGITFTDDLDAALSGLVAIGLPANDICGTGSQLTGTSVLTLTGGNLTALDDCSFNVSLQVPASAALGNHHTNTTSTLTGVLNGNAISGPASSDTLSIFNLQLSKSFQTDVFAGQLATLNFQLNNLDSSTPSQDIRFTDDLDAMIPGAVALGLPINGSCGAISQLSGSSLIAFEQGALPANGSCQFAVQVSIPAATAAGTYTNITSMVGVSGLDSGGAATADLTVNAVPTFSMTWQPTLISINGTSQAQFTIDNSTSTLSANQLSFTNNLPAGLAVASPSNASTTCTGGTLSAASGNTSFNYSGGSVAAGSSCTVVIDVTAQASGQFINTSGNLTSNAGDSGFASATLSVESPAVFGKQFTPNTALINEVVTLSFSIDNSANSLPANALDFTDNFPAGMTIASPNNASTTCTGGTLTTVAGSGTLSYTGGSIAAASSCVISVDVSSTTMGLNTNISGDLTSSSGNSGSATASLTIAGLPVFTQSIGDSELFVGQTTTLNFDIDNSATAFNITGLAFSNTLPAGIAVATNNNLTHNCGGTVSASGNMISLNNGSVSANDACQIQVDVIALTSGNWTNTSSDLSTDSGTVSAASSDVQVFDSLAISKSFANPQAVEGALIQMTLQLNNPSNQMITGASFSDDLDAFVSGAMAVNLPQNGVCGAASSVTGTNIIQITDVEIPAMGQCLITVEVQLPAAITGAFTNITSTLDYTVNGQSLNGPANSAGSAPINIIQGGPPAMVPTLQWPALLFLILITVVTVTRSKRQMP